MRHISDKLLHIQYHDCYYYLSISVISNIKKKDVNALDYVTVHSLRMRIVLVITCDLQWRLCTFGNIHNKYVYFYIMFFFNKHIHFSLIGQLARLALDDAWVLCLFVFCLFIVFNMYIHSLRYLIVTFPWLLETGRHSYRLGHVTWRYQARIPVGPNICHRGCAYTLLQTVQRQGVYSASLWYCAL